MVRVHAALFRVAPTRDNKIRKGEMIMAQKTGTVKWFSARRGYFGGLNSEDFTIELTM